MNVNSAFSSPSIDSPRMGRQKAKPDTVPAAPLFEWFKGDKKRRAQLRAAGYSDGRITNWKSRGIPRSEVGEVGAVMGISYEQYLTLAGIAAPLKSSHGLQLGIEEAEALTRLRRANPDWRRYVLGLAMIDSAQAQDLMLQSMRQAVPDYKVSDAYGPAPHVRREPLFTTRDANKGEALDGRRRKKG